MIVRSHIKVVTCTVIAPAPLKPLLAAFSNISSMLPNRLIRKNLLPELFKILIMWEKMRAAIFNWQFDLKFETWTLCENSSLQHVYTYLRLLKMLFIHGIWLLKMFFIFSRILWESSFVFADINMIFQSHEHCQQHLMGVTNVSKSISLEITKYQHVHVSNGIWYF